MKRVVSTGVCLGVLVLVGACAGGVGASDTRPTARVGTATIADGDGSAGLPDPTSGRTGPLPDGGAASCVESYAPDAVKRRAFAFDGVVVEVGPSVSDRGDEADLGLHGVTFEVQEWFSGGHGDTVAVDMQPAAGPPEHSDPDVAYGVGSRLLVSGEARWGGSALDSPIAWGCGFSRYHDPETATAWRDALAR